MSWVNNLSYYNFPALGISDYLGTIAIFNNVTNLYLRDDLSIKDFDRIRRDWENWIGTPLFWAPSDPLRIAICAKYQVVAQSAAFFAGGFSSAYFIDPSYSSLGTFKLMYYAQAPVLQSDTDGFVGISSDMQQALTQYVTADLLEQAQEFTKASLVWDNYNENVASYADRVKRINKSDLLLRV
jgi:hypothetical protein